MKTLAIVLSLAGPATPVFQLACPQEAPRSPSVPQIGAARPCDQTGQIFAASPFDREFIISSEDTGNLRTIQFLPGMRFYRVTMEGDDRGVLDPASLQAGDRICLRFSDSGQGTLRDVGVLSRVDIQRQQRQLLSVLGKNSVSGTIQSLNTQKRSIQLAGVDENGVSHATAVDASDPESFRRPWPGVSGVTDVSATSWEQLRPGGAIFAIGERDGGTLLRAALITPDPIRCELGSILSVDGLAASIRLQDLGSGKVRTVAVRRDAVFAISPPPSSGEKATPAATFLAARWSLHRVSLADLQQGDTIALFRHETDGQNEEPAWMVVTTLGSFRLSFQKP